MSLPLSVAHRRTCRHLPMRWHAALRRRLSVAAALLLVACSDGTTNPVPELVLSPDERALDVGESVQLSAINAGGAVTWTSSDPTVASVVSTGFVTAIGPGTTIISASTPTQRADATITVNARPALSLSVATVTFVARRGGSDPAVQHVSVTNSGSGTLMDIGIASVSYDTPERDWLEVEQVGATATPSTPASVRLTARVDELPTGTHSAVVLVGAANAENAPRELIVTLTVTPAPTLTVSPATMQFSSVAGDTTTRSGFSLISSNISGDSLTDLTVERVDPTATWLAASLSRTFTTSVVTFTASAESLAPGTYTTSMRIRSGTITENGPQDIDVTFIVASPPRLVLSASSTTFAAEVGGADPPPRAIAIANGGDTQLDIDSVAVRYVGGAAEDWLSAVLSRPTAPATLTLAARTGALAPGVYTAEVELIAPGADGSPAVIEVSFTIGEGPIIELSHTTLQFSGPPFTSTPVQEVVVTNGGGGSLGSLEVSVEYAGATGWLTVELGSVVAPTAMNVLATTDHLAPGTHTATIRVSSPDAANSPRAIAITLTVEPPPAVISLSTTSLNFTAPAGGGGPGTQVVLVTNSGSGTLSGLGRLITYESGSGWLSAWITPPSITTGSATLTVSANPGSLSAGTYSATVTVVSTMPGVESRTVQVTFTVPPPVLGVSATTLNFVRVSGTGTTSSVVSIVNAGAGTLSGLTANVISGAPWLTRALSVTSVTTGFAALTVTVNAGSGTASPRPPGNYTGVLRISSPVAGSVDITVNFTVPVSLANNLMPSLQSSACSGCHTWSTGGAFRTYVVNRQTTTRTVAYPLASFYPVRVVPGNAASSYLTYQLQASSGAYRMPTGSTPLLSVTVRNYIRDWINQGAQNN